MTDPSAESLAAAQKLWDAWRLDAVALAIREENVGETITPDIARALDAARAEERESINISYEQHWKKAHAEGRRAALLEAAEDSAWECMCDPEWIKLHGSHMHDCNTWVPVRLRERAESSKTGYPSRR